MTNSVSMSQARPCVNKRAKMACNSNWFSANHSGGAVLYAITAVFLAAILGALYFLARVGLMLLRERKSQNLWHRVAK